MEWVGQSMYGIRLDTICPIRRIMDTQASGGGLLVQVEDTQQSITPRPNPHQAYSEIKTTLKNRTHDDRSTHN